MSTTIGGQEFRPTGHLQSRQNRQTQGPALDQHLGTIQVALVQPEWPREAKRCLFT